MQQGLNPDVYTITATPTTPAVHLHRPGISSVEEGGSNGIATVRMTNATNYFLPSNQVSQFLEWFRTPAGQQQQIAGAGR
jgi:hypothetical protein